MKDETTEKIVSECIYAFAKNDFQQVKQFLANDVISYITNASGGVDRVEGRDAFMTRIPVNITSVKPDVKITQMLTIKLGQVLVMIEVKAEQKGKVLHNHAAYLMNIKKDKITELWMVEAQPAYSDEFWKL